MNKTSISNSTSISWTKPSLALLCVVIIAVTYPTWSSKVNVWRGNTVKSTGSSNVGNSSSSKGDESHDHSQHDDGNSLHLTPQSLKNLGLTADYLQPIKLSDYFRRITVPAIIVAKPGRTDIQVSSPMIGIVQHVHAVTGEAVEPGDLLFEVRLTYEDLVETQTQLIKNLADLEIEQQEVARLEDVTRSGAVASKVLLERQYALQKLQSSINAQRAALKLHGLSEAQVEGIVRDRRLLRDLSIVAPSIDLHSHEEEGLRLSGHQFRPASFTHLKQSNNTPTGQPVPMIVEQLSASKGQGVQAGEMLCMVSDYSTLYIEGKAFEQDAPAIAEVAVMGWPIEATLPSTKGNVIATDLSLTFVASAVDSQSRTLSFFVNLPNTILSDATTGDGQRFVTWKYRVGQRLELHVPVEAWKQQIVLPIDAAVKEGAEWYVFQQNGDHFDRVAVHVKHRDQRNVVIENDGAVFPGDVIAMRSAHQMQMAIKNKSGAGADPHAGHNH